MRFWPQLHVFQTVSIAGLLLVSWDLASAQSGFYQQDNFDFHPVHQLYVGHADPPYFVTAVRTGADFRTLKLSVKTGLRVGSDRWVGQIRVDIDDDGSEELVTNNPDTPAICTYHFPQPQNGLSQVHYIRTRFRFVGIGGGFLPPSEDRISLCTFTVYAAPRVYVDASGNALVQIRNQSVANRVPVLIVEGFDPTNNTGPDSYYTPAWGLINTVLDPAQYEVFILNFHDAGRDMRHNAGIVLSALDALHAMSPDKGILLAGMSMGGAISRYALAKAEGEGRPHHVGMFLSYDSPQKLAHGNRQLLDVVATIQHEIPLIQTFRSSIQSVAAKQLLDYNPYDPTATERLAFYSELNALNGDGYPHKSFNAAVSNGTLQPTWGSQMYGTHLADLRIFTYTGTLEEQVPISADPRDVGAGSTQADLTLTSSIGQLVDADPFFWLNRYYDFRFNFNPVFIPTWSALDLVDHRYVIPDDEASGIASFERSKFDDFIVQATPRIHGAVSAETDSAISRWSNRTSNVVVNFSLLEGGTVAAETYEASRLRGREVNIVPKTATVDGRQISYVFASWDDGSTLNPRVLVPVDDGVRTVIMKARLVSSSSGESWSSGQPRVAVTDADMPGSPGQAYHSVYESGGAIWLMHKLREESWGLESRMSPVGSVATDPTIHAHTWSSWERQLFLAWRDGAGGLVYRAQALYGGPWNAPIQIAASAPSPPLIPDRFSVMWAQGPASGGGMYYSKSPETNPTGVLVPGTAGTVELPAVCVVGTKDYELAFIRDGRVYVEGFRDLTPSYAGPTLGITSALTEVTTSTTSGWTASNPAIVGSIQPGPNILTLFVAWDESNGPNRRIAIRSRTNGVWSPVEYLIHEGHAASKPVLELDNSCYDPTLQLVWQCGNHVACVTRPVTSSTWWPLTDLGAGRSPSVSAIAGKKGVAMWTSGSTAPYSINLTSSVPCGDLYPPDPVYDLSVDALSSNELLLVWSASGDDGHEGTAGGYDIRVSESGIANENQFGMAWQVPYTVWSGNQEGWVPAVVGPPWSWQEQWIQGLIEGRWYHMALKTHDHPLSPCPPNTTCLPNYAPMSNVVSVRTLSGGGGGWLGSVEAGRQGENGTTLTSGSEPSDTMLVMLLDAGPDGASARLTKSCDIELVSVLDSADVAIGVEQGSGEVTWSQVMTPSRMVGLGALVSGKRSYVLSPRFIGVVFAEHADGSRLGDEASFRLTSAHSNAGEDRMSDALAGLGTAMSVGDTIVLTYVRADSVVEGDRMTIGMAVSPLTGGAQLRPRSRADGEPQASKTLTLRLPSPNPSRGLTRVTYAVEKRGEIRMAIFDLSGRRVRGVALGNQDPGVHETQWNGLDDNGAPARSGVYYCVIDGSLGKPQRIVLAR